MYLYVFIYVVIYAFASLEEYFKYSPKYILEILLISIFSFAGLRYETGQDWIPYYEYFSNIDISLPPLKSYFSNILNLSFEVGYFLLNYVIKLCGLGYPFVSFLASIFCGYAIIKFARLINVNKFYLITFYISYSYLLLHFAQVRQSIAYGFFILAFCNYIKNRSKVKTVLLGSLGVFFQYSCVIYLFGLFLVWFFPRSKWKKVGYIFSFLVVLMTIQYLGSYSILKFFTPETIEVKLDYYEDTNEGQSFALKVYGIYLFFCLVYMLKNYQIVKDDNHKIIYQYAIFTLLMAVISMFLFAGDYVMYSRMYILACLFQGAAFAIILKLKNNDIYHRLVFVLTTSLSMIMYLRIIVNNYNEYIPYKSVFILFL